MSSPETLVQLRIDQFLERLAAQTPTPGGGCVAALTGALAAALGHMVAAYTLSNPKLAAAHPQVAALAERLQRSEELFRTLMDEDAAAYEVLSAALKLEKSDPQRAGRVTEAARLAASVPLETATLAAKLLDDVNALAALCSSSLRSDAESCKHLAYAAMRAAATNVRANVPLMAEADRQPVAGQLDALLASREVPR
jgi:methenyltetrahydrofolate cyclohydrolase